MATQASKREYAARRLDYVRQRVLARVADLREHLDKVERDVKNGRVPSDGVGQAAQELCRLCGQLETWEDALDIFSE